MLFLRAGTAEELFDKLQHVLTLLHSATVDVTNSASHVLPLLVSIDFDLLLDALVVVWEVARPALARINSHSYATCRQFLSNHSTGKQVHVLIYSWVPYMYKNRPQTLKTSIHSADYYGVNLILRYIV